MRAISQNGEFDIPYEQMIIAINYNKKTEVIAYGANEIACDQYLTMAFYSTEEKAQKAMEMLKYAFLSHQVFKYGTVNIDVPENLLEGLYGVFQFPQESEVWE